MAPAATIAASTQNTSRGLRLIARASSATIRPRRSPGSSSIVSEIAAVREPLRTFSCPAAWVIDDAGGRREPLDGGVALAGGGRAVHRQAHGGARSLAEPARNLHAPAVQLDQALDDGQPQAGAVARSIIGAAHLEERRAETRKIVLADADPGILDRYRNVGAL